MQEEQRPDTGLNRSIGKSKSQQKYLRCLQRPVTVGSETWLVLLSVRPDEGLKTNDRQTESVNNLRQFEVVHCKKCTPVHRKSGVRLDPYCRTCDCTGGRKVVAKGSVNGSKEVGTELSREDSKGELRESGRKTLMGKGSGCKGTTESFINGSIPSTVQRPLRIGADLF